MHEAVTVECVVLLIPCLCVVDNTLNYTTRGLLYWIECYWQDLVSLFISTNHDGGVVVQQ